MHEGAGLLADIRETPDDLGLRRIHADWLEESGDPDRADFIRAMLDRAAAPRQSATEATLRRTAQLLLSGHWAEWTAPFRQLMGRMPGPIAEQWKSPSHALGAYPLGLLEWLRVDARVLLEHGDTIFNLAPVRRLDLYNPAECGLHLGCCRVLRWVETLSVGDRYIGPLDAPAMMSLAKSPHLSRLRELWLPHGNLGDRGAALLASAPWMADLSSLGLSDNGVSLEGVRAIAESHGFRPRMLDLSLNDVGDRGLVFLVEAGILDVVADLRLIESQIGDSGVEALARRWSVAGPDSMYLRDNRITDVGAFMLATAPWVGRVRFLDLADNPIGPQGRDALLRACDPGARVIA